MNLIYTVILRRVGSKRSKSKEEVTLSGNLSLEDRRVRFREAIAKAAPQKGATRIPFEVYEKGCGTVSRLTPL